MPTLLNPPPRTILPLPLCHLHHPNELYYSSPYPTSINPLHMSYITAPLIPPPSTPPPHELYYSSPYPSSINSPSTWTILQLPLSLLHQPPSTWTILQLSLSHLHQPPLHMNYITTPFMQPPSTPPPWTILPLPLCHLLTSPMNYIKTPFTTAVMPL